MRHSKTGALRPPETTGFLFRSALTIILLLAGYLAFSALVAAQSYQTATVDVPGATATVACGINDKGQVVGAYTDSSGQIHGFLDSGGAFTTIDIPGAAGTAACGINDSGQIVGTFKDASQ